MPQTHAGPVETFVEEDDNWFDSLQGPTRSRFLEALRELPLDAIHRVPPPKTGRIPFGHELRVAWRFVTGESMQFEPSAFASLYRVAAGERVLGLWRGLVANEALGRSTWEDLLGAETVTVWRDAGLMTESAEGLRTRFAVYSIEGVRLVADPHESRLLRRVICGQDSCGMARYMVDRGLARVGRYLDVGPGSGVILLVTSRYADSCLGLDINPRAVEISRLNAELNGASHCEVKYDDAIRNASAHGRFDLVTWNTPFVFLPEECKDTHFDAYGGDLGIQVLLDFIDVLPTLMDDGAQAHVAACGPIFAGGENPLEERLREKARQHGFTIRENVTQSNWHLEYRFFQEEHGIRRFEHSFLDIRRGPGRLERVEAPIGVRLADFAREQAFRIWK